MSTGKEPRTAEPRSRRDLPIKSLFGEDRFGVLLALLVLGFLVPQSRETSWIQAVVAVVALAAALAATGLWDEQRKLVVVVGSIGVAGGVLLAVFPLTSPAASLGAFGQSAVFLLILTAVVRRVLSHERVGGPTILGAIVAYFLIGLSYAWIYIALEGLVDGPVLDPAIDGFPSYYSFVVLSTLGFGDVTPVNDLAQRITAIEAITGQVFLATLVARLVSLYGQPRPRK
jgi:hypothetical protein